eukprot:29225-Pelagococcus_subviridis.AAC.14
MASASRRTRATARSRLRTTPAPARRRRRPRSPRARPPPPRDGAPRPGPAPPRAVAATSTRRARAWRPACLSRPSRLSRALWTRAPTPSWTRAVARARGGRGRSLPFGRRSRRTARLWGWGRTATAAVAATTTAVATSRAPGANGTAAREVEAAGFKNTKVPSKVK